MSREGSPTNEVLEAYWRIVKEDSGNFDGWVNLLQYCEQLDDIRECRAAYDEFLTRYPFCYGYWRKYAEMERRHHNEDLSLEVYESATKAVPLSIDIWLTYIEFYREYVSTSDSREKKIRHVYEKSLDAAGLEFRSDRLWEDYINWERSEGRLKNVLSLYDRLLNVPTLLYSAHFEKVQQFVNTNSPEEILLETEYYELFRSIESKLKEKNFDMYTTEVSDVKKEGDRIVKKEPKEGSGGEGDEDKDAKGDTADQNGDTSRSRSKSGSKSPKPEYRKRFSEEALKLFRLLILDKRRRLHLENEQEVSKRWGYENAIKRPYFHVKPLERAQLKNWRTYLDFEIAQGNKKRVQVLFERAVIACAMYEDIWVKYARYMAGISSDGARSVYQRACHVHLPKKPNPRLAWAAFEESRGHLSEARKILKDFADKYPGLVVIELRRIGLERRELALHSKESSSSSSHHPDYSDIVKMYESLIRHKGDVGTVASFYAVKYARFVAKIKGDRKLAQKILQDAVSRDPTNVQLYLQMIEIAFQSTPVDQNSVLRAFELALDSKIPSMEKLAISQRKLEFLEDLGTDIHELQDHYEWHLKYSKSLGVPSSRKRAADDSSNPVVPEKRPAILEAPQPPTIIIPQPPHPHHHHHHQPQPMVVAGPTTTVIGGPPPGAIIMAGPGGHPAMVGPPQHAGPPQFHQGIPPQHMQPGPGPQPQVTVAYAYADAQQQQAPPPQYQPHQVNQHGAYYYPPPYQQA